jgi:CheY-like chemotaxis protein
LTKTFQPLAQQKGLEFSITVEPGVPEFMQTDGQRLAQILKNLLANALKFTERGHVSMRVYSDKPNSLNFTVTDTGIGIPAEQQEVIFEAFRQADGSTHRRYGGTGLGLSISRDLAHLLGGKITVQSTPSKGSTFTLQVPIAYSPVMEVPTEPLAKALRPPAKLYSGNGARDRNGPKQHALAAAEIEDDRESLLPGTRSILVIEDDKPFAEIMRDLARERGFKCVVTHTANDGLAAAIKWRPSAILLDINLPDFSGLGVLDQLKRNSQTRHIPVHVASVADFTQEALGLGAIGYMLKPVKREELEQALKHLENKFSQRLKKVLIVEDDERQLESIRQLLLNDDVELTGATSANAALAAMQAKTFDCVVMDLNLPDLSGYALLEKMASEESVSFPPVIIYTGHSLTRDEEQRLRKFSKSIIIKDARSPERLLDEVALFLHQVEEKLPLERQQMLKVARDRESVFEDRKILIVEDDVRNIFALTSLLEPKGAKIELARNGKEAIEAVARLTQAGESNTGPKGLDLVLMDIMMPEMDGLTAMREIRKRPEWRKLPIIALTAKAMRDDQEKCLAAGANDYVAKPLDVEKLLSLIRVWLPK